jgi:predicted negative regulator of RcsB-dependent stress response
MAADVLTMRGYAFLASGDKAKAKADFQQTLQYLPGDPDATSGLKQASN